MKTWGLLYCIQHPHEYAYLSYTRLAFIPFHSIGLPLVLRRRIRQSSQSQTKLGGWKSPHATPGNLCRQAITRVASDSRLELSILKRLDYLGLEVLIL